MTEKNLKSTGRTLLLLLLAVMTAALLGGCGRSPKTLEGTSWKVTSLTAPDGTAYDEAAYDTLIGTTVYTFLPEGTMTCVIGGVEAEEAYTYTYEKGALVIRSEALECSGTVKRDRMKLELAGGGAAILTRQ